MDGYKWVVRSWGSRAPAMTSPSCLRWAELALLSLSTGGIKPLRLHLCPLLSWTSWAAAILPWTVDNLISNFSACEPSSVSRCALGSERLATALTLLLSSYLKLMSHNVRASPFSGPAFTVGWLRDLPEWSYQLTTRWIGLGNLTASSYSWLRLARLLTCTSTNSCSFHRQCLVGTTLHSRSDLT